MRDQRARLRGERGIILLVAAGLMFVIVAFVGLAFDTGYLQWSRRRAQTAADAAALAGAISVQLGSASYVTDAKNASKVNGFEDGQPGITVTINTPPTSGSYAGVAGAVEAIVSQDAPAFFMRILGYNILPVRARAVAQRGYGTACIYALDPTAPQSLNIQGGYAFTFGCGAIVASNDSNRATDIGGSSTVNMTNGASIGSVGNYRCNGQTGPTPCDRATPAYSVYKGAVFPGDPLAGLSAPTYTTQQCFDPSTLTMIATGCTGPYTPADGAVLSPGVYCGGINVNNGVNVTFTAGVYIIVGGIGLNFSNSTITANGVTFYMTDATTGSTWPCGTFSGNNDRVGPVSILSQANLTLTAPTTGTYAGIAIFENRGITSFPSDASINGGVSSHINGALYFPHSTLSFAGNGDSSGYQMLVSNKISFSGGATLSLNNFPTDFANNNPAFKQWIVMGE